MVERFSWMYSTWREGSKLASNWLCSIDSLRCEGVPLRIMFNAWTSCKILDTLIPRNVIWVVLLQSEGRNDLHSSVINLLKVRIKRCSLLVAIQSWMCMHLKALSMSLTIFFRHGFGNEELMKSVLEEEKSLRYGVSTSKNGTVFCYRMFDSCKNWRHFSMNICGGFVNICIRFVWIWSCGTFMRRRRRWSFNLRWFGLGKFWVLLGHDIPIKHNTW